jgi:hypothetical protein
VAESESSPVCCGADVEGSARRERRSLISGSVSARFLCVARFSWVSSLVRTLSCHLLSRWFAEPISSTLKMGAISYSETPGATQRTTRRHIPEDDTLIYYYYYYCRRHHHNH